MSVGDLGRGTGAVPGSVKAGEALQPVCEVLVDCACDWARALLQGRGPGRTQRAVLECQFSPAEGAWRALKVRTDKNIPNSTRTAFSTLEVMAEGLSLEDVVEALEAAEAGTGDAAESAAEDAPDKLGSYTNLSLSELQGRSPGPRPDRSYITQPSVQQLLQEPIQQPPATPLPPQSAPAETKVQAPAEEAPAAGEAVDSHYDRIQRDRRAGGRTSLDEDIAMLRRVQNWNKACMIKRLFAPGLDRGPASLEELLAELYVDFDPSAVAPLLAPGRSGPAPSEPKSRAPLKILVPYPAVT